MDCENHEILPQKTCYTIFIMTNMITHKNSNTLIKRSPLKTLHIPQFRASEVVSNS